MKKLKELNETVREFNGLSARTRKNPTDENKALFQECLVKLAAQAEVLLNDKTFR